MGYMQTCRQSHTNFHMNANFFALQSSSHVVGLMTFFVSSAVFPSNVSRYVSIYFSMCAVAGSFTWEIF